MDSPLSFIPGHTPPKDNILFNIGTYQVYRSIGKGGMGEVFLAFDTTCGRKLALKKIRPDLSDHPKIHNRFRTEARITSQLAHPAIIPIYAIHEEPGSIYYTMPFVEGNTLKQILNETYQREKKGEENTHLGTIPSLMRIFLQVCQAIAYAHSNNVLHRDIKPDNIIVGPFGEVFILDWGLAKLANQNTPADEGEEEETDTIPEYTRAGKVVGTVSYMAPERAKGNPANFQTDIYSLGVILYQILTLHLPFKRGTLSEFRQSMDKEILPDPAEQSPYRDVPASLAHTVRKCLTKNPNERYGSVQNLIEDLESYIEGRSSWIPAAELHIDRKKDWEFQENVFLADHIAITREAEEADWVSLMISKPSFAENIKFEATVKIGENGHGIGILLCLPEAAERLHLNEGYCLWLGSDISKSTKLTLAGVEVMHAPEIYLTREVAYHIKIEKIEHNLYFYLNDALQFSYISHLPLVGTHVGLIARDDNFHITPITIFIGSQSIMVNCLAVPDAFLAHKDYATALNEYRRIGYSFHGRQEGREAVFRAGVTLMEQAKAENPALYDEALEEFEKLHNTPGAPLEYLGKSLVYRCLGEYEEEIKCFELAYRRYPNHPMLGILQEQIIFRMHESSRSHRKATYHFILLTVQHLPKVVTSLHTKKLFKSLQKHWEPLPFIEEDPLTSSSRFLQNTQFAIKLAFWLAKPYVLTELIQEQLKKEKRSAPLITNALFALIELGSWELAQKRMHLMLKRSRDAHLQEKCRYLEQVFQYHEGLKPSFALKTSLNEDELRLFNHIVEDALANKNTSLVFDIIRSMKECVISEEYQVVYDCFHIWALLLDKQWNAAGDLLHRYTLEQLNKETSLLHFLYGCWLTAAEGEEIATIHFRGVLPAAFPRTWAIFSHYMYGKPDDQETWLNKAFLWEKRKLWQQMSLYYHCKGEEKLSRHYDALEKETYIKIHE